MKKYLFIMFLSLTSFTLAAQTTYFVEKSGLDSNQRQGISSDDAWASIGFALKKAEDGSIIR
ncbi:MAG: hypothetical protein LBS25_07490, partial [Candidatus Symbiothrix sp.]|nr:hypothetical protein [Candidatus Symbiothrix sp.]